MNLRKFYKQEIKKIASQLKILKPAGRKLSSLYAKGICCTIECGELEKICQNLPPEYILSSRSRYLNLAYAIIRNKDLSKVEKNNKEGNQYNPETLDKLLKEMEKSFLNQKEI